MKFKIKKISAKKTLLIILGVFVVIIFYKFSTLLFFPDSSIALEKGDPQIKLQPSQSMSQKFVGSRSNLSKLEFLLRTPGPRDGDPLKMELADESCTKILRSGILTPSFLASSNLFEFSFSKIPDSKGKTFCLIASFEPKNPTAKALQFFTQEDKNPPFSIKNLTTGEQDPAQALSMRPVYANDNLGQDLRELDQRMSQYKPWFLKHYFIAAIAILFVILSISLVVILIVI